MIEETTNNSPASSCTDSEDERMSPGLHVIPNALDVVDDAVLLPHRVASLRDLAIGHCAALDPAKAAAQTVPRFRPCHGAYHARMRDMSAAMSSLKVIVGPMPMTFSG